MLPCVFILFSLFTEFLNKKQKVTMLNYVTLNTCRLNGNNIIFIKGIIMVRTFLCHPFAEPRTFSEQYNPTSLCYTADDRLIVASKTGLIFVHSLKSITCSHLCKFPSTGVPVKLLFCDNKQFIVSLEVKLHEYDLYASTKSVTYNARVYFNFMKSVQYKIVTPLNYGYSNNIQQNNLGKYTDQLVVLDLGTCGSVSDISICSINNNVAVSSCKKVNIYGLKQTEFSFEVPPGDDIIDFFKLIEISLTYDISNVCFVSNWLALASKTELRVVQFFISQTEDNHVYQAEDVSEFLDTHSLLGDSTATSSDRTCLNKVTVNESISLDENFIVWNFNQYNDNVLTTSPDRHGSVIQSGASRYESFSKKNVISLFSIKEEIPYVDNHSSSKEIIGPIEELVGHPLEAKVVHTSLIEKGSQFCRRVSCVTLLYRRFDPNEMSNLGDNNSLHSLQWLPIFAQGSTSNITSESTEAWPWNVFDIKTSVILLGIPLFFSTGKEGYLYDISSGSIRRAATYQYTSDCSAAVHTRSLLYTVNKTGLEAYTSRLYPLAAEYSRLLFQVDDLKNKTFLPHRGAQRFNSKKRSETDVFTDVNYFGSYVTIDPKEITDTDFSIEEFREIVSLPVYSPLDLILPCPSLQLEVCLVGMYMLQNIQLIGCSTSYTVLLIKAVPGKEKTLNSVTPWSIYILENVPVTDFYDELMDLIRGNEFSNPTIYNHLVNEAQLILRSELISGSAEETELKPYVKQSALKIADFLSRCKESFSKGMIPKYFEMAGIEFEDVLRRFLDEDLPKEKKYLFGNDFIEYLSSKVFEPTDLKLDQDLTEFIMRIYLKNQPSMLSTVILKSGLKNISDELGVKFVTKYKNKQESKGKRVLPYDLLCLSVLYMRLGNPAQVEDILKDVPQETLQNLCTDNYTLLFDENLKILPCGQLLKKRFKMAFIGSIIKLFDAEKISLENIVNIYKKTHDENIFCKQLCRVLELMLNDASRKKHFHRITDLLTDQYLIHIMQTSKGLFYDGWKNNHHHIPKGNGHFAPRFSWLDDLHPFTGEPACPQDCVGNKSNRTGKDHQTERTINSSPKSFPNNISKRRESPNVSTYPKPGKLDERVYCPCCCCSEVLLKFQSLLCSKQNKKELSSKVLDKLNHISFVGKESLLLLCWPKVGLVQESVEYMVKNYPSSLLQYAKDMFEWKAQWQVLLQYLLTLFKANDYEQWNRDQYIDILKGVLLRLTKVYTPSEYLEFLPSDGSIQFFLPYLHECWEYNKAVELKQRILATYKAPE